MRKIGLISVVGVATIGALYMVSMGGQLTNEGTKFLQQIDAVDGRYTSYMARHGKSYGTKEEYVMRKQLYERSLKFVDSHNARPDVSSWVAINHFSDMTREEIKQFLGDNGATELDKSYFQTTEEIAPPLNADP